MNKIWTIQEILNWCTEYLKAHNDEHARRSAEWILGACTGMSRVELYTQFDKPVSVKERDDIREALKRRGAGEPLQYISGECAFRHIVLRSEPGVLIPRPETEVVVQCVLDEMQESASVLEIGTGTGCIALSLAKEAGAHIVATDISAQAIDLAKRNAQVLGLESQIEFIECDLASGLHQEQEQEPDYTQFDVLVSNPPYIPTDVLNQLPREVSSFEPRLALDGGEDGLNFYRRLLNEALQFLRPGGLFACELHETCLDQAADLANRTGLSGVRIKCDLAGKPRILLANR